MRWSRLPGLVCAAFLGGCLGPVGPVFGDWYGYSPLALPQSQVFIELVLHGTPDATGGTYRVHTQTLYAGDAQLFNRSDYGDGRWVLRQRGGWREIDLAGGLMDGKRYAIVGDRGLLPLLQDGSGPNETEAGLRRRLAARKPGSFGYGRA